MQQHVYDSADISSRMVDVMGSVRDGHWLDHEDRNKPRGPLFGTPRASSTIAEAARNYALKSANRVNLAKRHCRIGKVIWKAKP